MNLVFNIGGTSLRAATLNENLDVILKTKCTNTPKNFELVAHRMKEIGSKLMGEKTPEAIAVGFPGPVAPNGDVQIAPTISSDQITSNIGAVFQEKWPDTSVYVVNDVTTAGFYFLKKGLTDFAVLNIGSGIGLKLFIDGKVQIGEKGMGGEIGHFVVDKSDDAPMCDCWGRGHLGAIASGRGTLSLVKGRAIQQKELYLKSLLGGKGLPPLELNNSDLVDAFRQDDDWLTSIVAEAIKPLAEIIASIHLSVGVPRFFLVGGFVSAMGERYRNLLVCEARKSAWDTGTDWDQMIRIVETTTDLFFLGAGYVLRREHYNL